MARPKRSRDDCPYDAAAQALKCLGGRWKILIVKRLVADGSIGFNELQRLTPGVSAKMLTQQLRELEADGLVRRREIVSSPPKTVRYELTELGAAAEPSIDALAAWGSIWIDAQRPEADDRQEPRDPAQ